MSIKHFIFTLLMCSSLHASDQPFTIMIDPSGDAKHTGRLIQDTLERGISLQYAEALKKALMQKFTNLRVVFTRVPGETIKPLQNASFANRLDINLYLSFYFYQEPTTPAFITIYHYVSHPITDLWHKMIPLCFYRSDQAHLINIKTTQTWGNQLLNALKQTQATKAFELRGFFGIPFKPLVGIQAPALAVEVGLQHKDDWKRLIDPITKAMESIIV